MARGRSVRSRRAQGCARAPPTCAALRLTRTPLASLPITHRTPHERLVDRAESARIAACRKLPEDCAV
jgi:hypothetical protein